MTAVPAMLANRYKLEERIGEGSFATTYRATDTKLLRTVAVKILRERHAADDAFSARFRREAQAAAQVDHPNVVQVHDYGQDGEHVFIVMHHVGGPTLAEYVRGGGELTMSGIVKIVSQILDGLAAIHDRGIVHRDIKPQNVLLEEDLTPKLGDFGVASSAQAMTLTQTGTTIGTAAYMAPEQATGEQTGPPADLYAVGIILYELTTGRLPFTGTSPVQVMYQHVNKAPEPPSNLNPDISPAIEAVILRALAKRPEDRYPDARSMRQALVNAGMATEEIRVVPPVNVVDQPTVVNRPPPPPPGGRRVAGAGEPARWPYVLGVLVVAVAVVALLIATMGDGFGILGAGDDDNNDSTPTVTDVATTGDPELVPDTATPTVEPIEPPQPSPTDTEEPPAPTATPEPPTATPEPPPPTETPVPEPTETPVPEPEPTETPAPEPTEPEEPTPEESGAVDVFVSSVAGNTPFDPDQLPEEILDGPMAEFGRDDFVQGGAYRRQDGVLYDRPAAHLYAQTTDYPAASVSLALDETPSRYAVIRIVGMDDEAAGNVPMRITVNDYIVHDGPSPFGNEAWTDVAWRIADLGILQAGQNTITIENRSAEGEFGLPPWILLTSMQVYTG